MLDRNALVPLILEALKANGGSARIHEVGKYIWDNHEPELKQSGNFFISGSTSCGGLAIS